MTIDKNSLLRYLQNEEVGFQFADSLMDFTRNVSSEEIEELVSHIENSTAVKLVANSKLPYPNGMEDLAQWAQENDSLVLIDESLLLCLPTKDLYKITAA